MRRIFFDIDTQLDFLLPAGALHVPGAEELIPTLTRLNRHAVDSDNVLISTTCAHSENDPEFREWPPHCILGTTGQAKPSCLILNAPVTIGADAATVPPVIDATFSGQIILQKRAIDMFTNPNLLPLLEAIDAHECVVYGVVAEVCVKFAAVGLLRHGKRVSVVRDAVKELSPGPSAAFFAEFEKLGGHVLTSRDLLG